MMREALNQWDYVIAAYVIGLGALIAVTIWAWQTMRRAEQRRNEVKRR